MEYTSVVVAVDHIVYSKPCRKQAAHQVSTQCPTGAEVNQKEYLFLYFKKWPSWTKAPYKHGTQDIHVKSLKESREHR